MGKARREWRTVSGKQAGDPSRLAQAVLALAATARPPLRFVAGTDAVATMAQAISLRREDLGRWRGLSESLAHES